MKYILDFDRVLFNVWSLRAERTQLGVEELNYTPAIWDHISVSDHVYSDVVPFLIKHTTAELIIMSAATPSFGPQARAFQERKLRECGLDEYVSRIIVMEGDKGPFVAELVDETKRTVFVDDKLSNLTSTKQLVPSTICLQMIREGGEPEAGIISETPDIPVIHSLEEIDTYV